MPKFIDAEHTAIRLEDGRTVPVDPRNRDYAELIASGVDVDPYTPPPAAVPASVTNYQARAALIDAGLFPQVDDAVEALGRTSKAYQAWNYGTRIYRNSPFISAMAEGLGLSDATLDALFVAAEQVS